MLLVGAVAATVGFPLLTGALGAASSVSGRSVTFGGPIEELKADAGRAIVLVGVGDTQKFGEYCAESFVWNPATGKLVTVFDRRTCHPELMHDTSFGVALAGNNVAWVRTTGGNIYETTVNVMSLTTGRFRGGGEPAGAFNDGAWGSFMVNPHGDGSLIVYNNYERCEPDNLEVDNAPCQGGQKGFSITSDQIWLVLPTERRIASADEALTVLSVGGNRVVARKPGGGVIVLSFRPSGKKGLVAYKGFKAEHLIASFPYKPGEVRAAATDGRTLAVLRAGALDVIPLPGTPGARTTRQLPHAASYGADRPVACLEGPYPGCDPAIDLRLTDLDGHIAVFVRSTSVYLLDLTTGRSVIIARSGARPVNAQLEPEGLYIASGRTLTFTPRDQVEQRLDH